MMENELNIDSVDLFIHLDTGCHVEGKERMYLNRVIGRGTLYS